MNADVFPAVTGSAENNVCEPERENDFCDVGILSQSQFSSNNPRTTARGMRASHYWRIMWALLSVKFVMFLGLKLLMSTRKNALKFVVEKKMFLLISCYFSNLAAVVCM